MNEDNKSIGTYLGNNLYYDTTTNDIYVVDNNGIMHTLTTTSTAPPTNYSLGFQPIPTAQSKPKVFESEKISSSLIDIISDELNIST